jgi:hypothetical protein
LLIPGKTRKRRGIDGYWVIRRKNMKLRIIIISVILFAVAIPVCCTIFQMRSAEEIPASVGHGRSEIIEGLAVVHVYGTPRERGRALGDLLGARALKLRDGYLKPFVKSWNWIASKRAALEMENLIPKRFREQMQGFSGKSGMAYDEVLLTNVFLDLRMSPFCSTTCAIDTASENGKPIVGRNLDFPTFGIAEHHTILVIEHLENGKALAMVTWPGMIGALSGINSDGLTLFSHDSGPGETALHGMPYILFYRDILEKVTTVDDAVAMLKSAKRNVTNNVVLVDRTTATVVEYTSDKIAVRRPENSFIHCTNHFRAPSFGGPKSCRRYTALENAAAEGKYDYSRVKGALKDATFPGLTMQSMIMQPVSMKMWLASGKVPATEALYVELDLNSLFAEKPDN